MITIPAQEIKRRGISAVDDLICKGDVHIIKNNQPQYVVLSEMRYRELMVDQGEELGYTERVLASMEDVKAGRVRRFSSAQELINALGLEGED